MTSKLRGARVMHDGENVVLLTPIVERLRDTRVAQMFELSNLREYARQAQARELTIAKRTQFFRDGIRKVAQKEKNATEAAAASAQEICEFHEAINILRFDVNSLEVQLQAVQSRESQLKELYAVKRLRHAEEAEQRQHEDALAKRKHLVELENSSSIGLSVTLIQASILHKGNVSIAPNVFSTCRVTGREDLQFKTEVANTSKAPFWNHTSIIRDYPLGSSLEFVVWNRGAGKDDFLGKATLTAEKFFPLGFSGRLTLEKSGMRKKEKSGSVDIAIKNLRVSDFLRARVTIISVQGIRTLETGTGSFCVCEVLGDKTLRFETNVIDCTQALVWNYSQEFKEFGLADALKISVWNRDDVGDYFLGRAVVLGSDVFPYSFTGDVILSDTGENVGATLTINVDLFKDDSSHVTPIQFPQHDDIVIGIGSLLICAPSMSAGDEIAYVFETSELSQTLRDIHPGEIVVAVGMQRLQSASGLAIVPIQPAGFVLRDSFVALPKMEQRRRMIGFEDGATSIRNGTVLLVSPPEGDEYRHADIFQDSHSEKGLGTLHEYATVVAAGVPVLDACVMVPIRPNGFVQLSLFEVIYGIEQRKKIGNMSAEVDLIKLGSVLVCIIESDLEERHANVFESVDLQRIRRVVPEGCTVMAAGPPIHHGDNVLVPISPRGFVQLALFEIVEGLEDSLPRSSQIGESTDKQNSPSKTSPSLPIFRPALISVKIVRAKGLVKSDATGSCDPYCLCELLGQTELAYKTHTIRNSNDPIWDHTKELGYLPGDRIRFSVYDHVEIGDDVLGRKTISHSKFYPGGFDGTIFLDDGGHANGSLTVKIDVLRTEAQMSPPRPLSAESPIAITVTVLRAKNLQTIPTIAGCDPYCVCEVLEMPWLKFKTGILKSTTSPEWNHVHEFTHYLPGAGLLFSLYRQPSISLGQAILEDARFIAEGFEGGLSLVDTGNDVLSTLEVRVQVTSRSMQQSPKQLVPLEISSVNTHAHHKRDKVRQIGLARIRVTIIGVRGLRKAEISCRASSYCVCELEGSEVAAFKTKVLANTQAPFWNHAHDIVDYSPGKSLKFSLWNQVSLGDDLLGTSTLGFESFYPKGFDGELDLQEAQEGSTAALILIVEVLEVPQGHEAMELHYEENQSSPLAKDQLLPSRKIGTDRGGKVQSVASSPALSAFSYGERSLKESSDQRARARSPRLATWDLQSESTFLVWDEDQSISVLSTPKRQHTPQPRQHPDSFIPGDRITDGVQSSSGDVDAELLQAGLRPVAEHGSEIVGSKAHVCTLLQTKINAVKEEHDATLRAMSARLDEERRLRLALQTRLEQAKEKVPIKLDSAAGGGSDEDPWASSSDEADPDVKGVEFSGTELLADRQPSLASSSSSRDL